MSELRIVGEAVDHAQLIAVIRAWVVQLGVTYGSLDELAGLPERYVNKLLRPVPIKGLNRFSMGPLLGALGLKLVIAVNTEQLERMAKRHVANRWTQGRKDTEKRRAGAKQLARKRPNSSRQQWTGNSEWGRMLRMRQIVLSTPEGLQRVARKGGKARARLRRKLMQAAKIISVPKVNVQECPRTSRNVQKQK